MVLTILVVIIDVLRHRGTLGPVDYLTYFVWLLFLASLGTVIFGVGVLSSQAAANIPYVSALKGAILPSDLIFAIGSQVVAARKLSLHERG
ncbi:hypothetical protein [Nocardia blacklockiae]|uniref:hypothetical protein n=1 Tax=Nocardia blacklockiae TaxID=480036 RepID=UPI001893477C|nr:hypothetical protein [Nocardia blacklockiae]MBF6172105.1 hypothetical protein [Nocardia blacklockiae]